MAKNQTFFSYRIDGTRYQVVYARERGDTFYRDRPNGWYWHDLDNDYAVIISSITGPYATYDLCKMAAQVMEG